MLVAVRARIRRCGLGAVTRSCTFLRARWRVLLTDGTVVCSNCATSRAENPSTSRRMSTARSTAWQVLERGQERKFHRLALLVSTFGCPVPARAARRRVGVRLHPDRMIDRLAPVARTGGRAAIDWACALLPRIDRVEARVGRDRVQPRPKPRAVEQPGQSAPGPEHGVLECVVGFVHGVEHARAVRVDLCSVGFDEGTKCDRVAGVCSVEDVTVLTLWMTTPFGKHRFLANRAHTVGTSESAASRPRRPPAGCRSRVARNDPDRASVVSVATTKIATTTTR